MPYVVLKDFRGGLDRRRRQVVGLPGTLWELRNAVITEGGDIERRKAMVPVFTLPAGTFGLSGNGNALRVWGTIDEPANMPRRISYEKLTGTNLYSGGLFRILDADYFNGQSYVIAMMGDGAIEHFYKTALVTDWRQAGLQPTVASRDDVAAYLAQRITLFSEFRASAAANIVQIEGAPGQSFTVDVNAIELSKATIQSATAGTPETRATAIVTINSGSAGGLITSMFSNSKPLIENPVSWVSNTVQTAVALAEAINAYRETHGFLAQALSNTVKLTAPVGSGAGANAWLTLTYTDGVDVTDAGSYTGGVTAVPGLSQITQVNVGGIFGSGTNYWLTVDGQPFRVRASVDGAFARFAMTHRGFVYSAARTLLYRSAVNDPTKWPYTGHAYTGATTIGTGNASGALAYITGLGAYLDDVAVFSAVGVQVWSMDPDPTKNARRRFIPNTGTRAGRSILAWGNDDLLYLAENGIRSLQSADSSGRARMADVGSPIDPIIQSAIAEATDLQIEQAQAVVDPVSGRFMLSLGNKIYVLSDFPHARIRAWSVWDLEFNVDYMTVAGRRVYLRSGDTVYCYGGLGNNQWPAAGEAPVIVETPFYDAGTPGHKKTFRGFDAALENEWRVQILLDPNRRASQFNIGRLSGITYAREDTGGFGQTSHMAVRMTCSEAGKASIANILLHYDGPPPPTVG